MKITASFSRKDLCKLCVVSRSYLYVIRTLLYRDVEIRGDFNHDIQATLDLLQLPNSSVAGAIRSLSLHGFKDLGHSQIPFKNMPNMVSLAVVDCILFIA